MVTVERAERSSCAPSLNPMVPIVPVGTPAAIRPLCRSATVVVLPLVPVTPSIVISRAGSPKSRAATVAMAVRTSAAATTGTSEGPISSIPASSVSTATAPESIAEAANCAPCALLPGTAT